MHQSSKSLWPSSRGGPEVSKTPPTCKVWMILCQVMTSTKKQCFEVINDLLCILNKIVNQNYFLKLLFSLNCHNLAQNHPNFVSWGCFGNLRTSSSWCILGDLKHALWFSKKIAPTVGIGLLSPACITYLKQTQLSCTLK